MYLRSQSIENNAVSPQVSETYISALGVHGCSFEFFTFIPGFKA